MGKNKNTVASLLVLRLVQMEMVDHFCQAMMCAKRILNEYTDVYGKDAAEALLRACGKMNGKQQASKAR